MSDRLARSSINSYKNAFTCIRSHFELRHLCPHIFSERFVQVRCEAILALLSSDLTDVTAQVPDASSVAVLAHSDQYGPVKN
jgi:hypothetical protein